MINRCDTSSDSASRTTSQTNTGTEGITGIEGINGGTVSAGNADFDTDFETNRLTD